MIAYIFYRKIIMKLFRCTTDPFKMFREEMTFHRLREFVEVPKRAPKRKRNQMVLPQTEALGEGLTTQEEELVGQILEDDEGDEADDVEDRSEGEDRPEPVAGPSWDS